MSGVPDIAAVTGIPAKCPLVALPERKDMNLRTANPARMRPRRRLTSLALGAVVTCSCILALVVSSARAATLANMSWTVSSNQVSAANTSYSYSFKTTTAGTIGKITFAVSGAGLAGAPTITRVYGIGAGLVARAGQTITYSYVVTNTGVQVCDQPGRVSPFVRPGAPAGRPLEFARRAARPRPCGGCGRG